MKLSDPRQAYVQILKQLSGKILTWEQAYNVLEKKFNSNAKRPMTLLLVDEVYIYIFLFYLFLIKFLISLIYISYLYILLCVYNFFLFIIIFLDLH